MDAKQLFFERYNGFREYPERLTVGLTEQQLRRSPHESMNPIAWTLWHIARCEDIGVNRLLTDESQVFDEGDWANRLGVPDREMGTGMSKARVAELCDQISVDALKAYRTVVVRRTESAIDAFPLMELNNKLDAHHLRRVFVDEGAGGGMAMEIVGAYDGHSKGWLLGHLILTHSFYHIGEAFAVRAMFGAPNPW